jgi:hypothetical protein
MFVQRDGKAWDNAYFFKGFALPAMARMKAEGHPGLAGINLKETRRVTIRMWRRGGEKFVLMNKVNPDLVDLMGRWRPRQQNREPSIMRQRYYEMECEDGWAVTSAAPERRSEIGFCAWYRFEPSCV